METDRPLPGLALMLCFCLLAPLADTLGKVLVATVPVLVVVFARFAVQAVVLTPFLIRRGLPRPGRAGWLLSMLRTALMLAGTALMLLSLRYLPIAEALAIAYVMPFIALLLGHLFLQEVVGVRRLAASVVGFIGTLLVIQPSFAEIGLPALLPLAVAVIFAVFMLVTRVLTRRFDPMRLQAINGWQGVIFLIPFAVFLPGAGAEAALGLGPAQWWLLLGAGLIGALAHLAMAWSLQLAPAASVVPVQYLEIPMAALYGWLIFADLPDPLAWVGIAVTMSAGLYVIHRARLQD